MSKIDEEFLLPEDCDRRVRQIHDYWLSIHPGKGLPAREDLDPVDVPSLLPNLWLANVEHNPLRFRYRLIGSEIVHVLGDDLTGRYFDECFDNFVGSRPYATLVEMCMTGRPAWRRGAAVLTRKDYRVREMERIFLPFATDGVTVDLFLALSVYRTEEESVQSLLSNKKGT